MTMPDDISPGDDDMTTLVRVFARQVSAYLRKFAITASKGWGTVAECVRVMKAPP